MDVPKTDLIVGLVGAIALSGLVLGLFVVDGGTGATDDVEESAPDDADIANGSSTATYDNETFSGTLEAGLNPPDSDQGESSTSHMFPVENGTYEIQVGLEFDTGTPGDLDCHLYDPNGTKHGDSDCHTGTADSPQGANFTLMVNASQVGEWEVVIHTGESGDANLNSDKDYTVWISRAIRT